MKILIINGSPRKQGHILKMLQLMETEAKDNGDEVTVVRVADLAIRPCIGCMSCREKLKCCLPEDDAQRVLKQIEEAHALIIGAPCYWGNLPGQLKVMFDRIVYEAFLSGCIKEKRPLSSVLAPPRILSIFFLISQGEW